MISPASISDWAREQAEKPLVRPFKLKMAPESREVESRELLDAIKRMTRRPS